MSWFAFIRVNVASEGDPLLATLTQLENRSQSYIMAMLGLGERLSSR